MKGRTSGQWKGKAAAVLLLLVSAWALPAWASVPEIPRFRLMSVADGLPSTTIPVLARDKAGFLWLATWDGVARYDGVNFRVWRHEPDDPASLPGNVVQALHIDEQDRVWVATENGGLSMMGPERRGFRHFRRAQYPEMGSDDIFTITSHGKEVWFGTFGGGLNRITADGRFLRFRPGADDENLPSDNVLSIAFDQQGQMWVGTMSGLVRYDGKRTHAETLPAGEALIIYSLTPDGDSLWAGTSGGMFRWRKDSGWSTPSWSRMFERPNAVNALTPDGSGEYWLASQGGLWHTDGDRAPTPIAQDSQGAGVGRVVQTLLREPDGGLWVPVPTRGVAYLRADWRRIASFTPAQGLGGGLYRGLARSAQGLWLVSSLGGVERLDTVSGEVTPLGQQAERFRQLRFTSVLEDRQGRLWLGHRYGLIRLDPGSGEVREWSNGNGADAVPDSSSIDWLVQARDGSLWLGTQLGSLQRRDADTGKVLTTLTQSESDPLPQEIEAMTLGPDGQPWTAGTAGVRRWDSDTQSFVTVVRAGVERILSFAFVGTDTIWLHRLSGLERWQSSADGWQQSATVGPRQGLPALESTGLAVDPQRRLWLATRRGVFRIELAADKTPAATPSVRVRNFGVRDGLMSQEFNDRGLLMVDDGLLAGSTADGSVMLLDTQLPDSPPHTPNLLIDGLHVSRGDRAVPLSPQGGFELRPDDQELQLSLRLLSYENPLANRYRSRLEGFDPDWVDQGASGERVFSTLRPGHYRLHLQAFDASGTPSEEKVLKFQVLPPWYRSGWGIALLSALGVLLLLALAAAYRRRVRRRTEYQLAQHKREVAEQASLAKTRFLATLGHEVRTPMTGVLGMSELLLGTPLDDRQRNYTSSIQQAGQHLLRLVNDALDLARIEAGKLELDLQPLDLRALVNEVTTMNAPIAQKRGLQFELDYAADAPAHVMGDPLRLRQILHNLLGNAIKFTERGKVGLRVSSLSPQGVRLEVHDTGPGINTHQQARLFQRFEQAEGARTAARYGGSGLGLAICQELAVAMGGAIQVDSKPGLGTRFLVDLPLQTVAAPTPVATQGSGAVEPLNLLLVEDDATVAEVIVALLRARGHQVTHAPNGLAALGEIAAQRFDIALLDLDLPGLDGLALARQLRLGGFSAPLLAITARADAEAEPQARAAGFDAFLRKPVTGDMLAEAVKLARG
ncbi:hybrid sensor histidine kinase/response regulator [Pseudoxanthomonas indica]|nr:hybrid sensor histidine kinase/response regulator [Pseudoxanthomonas indica]GGD36031.1 histidine kinase [Pseudoxanthomonas indica]